MYQAKQLGRGRIEVFDDRLRADLEARQRLRDELRTAIPDGEIHVHYQPIVDIDTAEVRGYEALARSEHPERGMLGPAAFMPAAESSGMIDAALGAGVLGQACRQLAAWQRDPSMAPELYMAVNLSVRQLVDRETCRRRRGGDRGVRDQARCACGLEQIAESALLTDARHRSGGAAGAARERRPRLVSSTTSGYRFSTLQHLKHGRPSMPSRSIGVLSPAWPPTLATRRRSSARWCGWRPRWASRSWPRAWRPPSSGRC